jgi:hypothetical protein
MPPLPPPRGEVIRVATVDELLSAIDRLPADATIALADGHYKLPRPIVLDYKTNVVLRSAGGDPAKVTLTGRGWETGSGDAMAAAGRPFSSGCVHGGWS